MTRQYGRAARLESALAKSRPWLIATMAGIDADIAFFEGVNDKEAVERLGQDRARLAALLDEVDDALGKWITNDMIGERNADATE